MAKDMAPAHLVRRFDAKTSKELAARTVTVIGGRGGHAKGVHFRGKGGVAIDLLIASKLPN